MRDNRCLLHVVVWVIAIFLYGIMLIILPPSLEEAMSIDAHDYMLIIGMGALLVLKTIVVAFIIGCILRISIRMNAQMHLIAFMICLVTAGTVFSYFGGRPLPLLISEQAGTICGLLAGWFVGLWPKVPSPTISEK